VTTNADRAATLARALEAGIHGDVATLAGLYTDDVTAWTPAFFVDSAAELLAVVEVRDDVFSDIELTVRPLDVGGNHACAEWQATMTHTGPITLAGDTVVEATGHRVTVYGATFAEFRDDKICSLRQYWDELALFEQLGVPLVAG
jgi:ketosteroid isomerase-like protein